MKLGALRGAIDAGDTSGIAEDGVFERVSEKLSFLRHTTLTCDSLSFLAPGRDPHVSSECVD